MNAIKKLEAQAKAITLAIEKGKAKNIFAAKNKVNSLRNQIYNISKNKDWNNFLAQ